MHVIAEWHADRWPPRLDLYIRGAPHRRQHPNIIRTEYRKMLVDAVAKLKIPMPIAGPFDLWLLFIDPSSPDNNNLIQSLYTAIDGHVVLDDRNIQSLTMHKLFIDAGSRASVIQLTDKAASTQRGKAPRDEDRVTIRRRRAKKGRKSGKAVPGKAKLSE